MPKLINGVAYDISQPYQAGHTINEAEARVLNQTRAENIGNNLRARLKELADEGQPPEILAQLVAEKDAEYVFTMAEARAARIVDPVEREAIKLAKELLKEHLAASGRKLTVAPEGLTKEEWEAKIEAEIDRIAASEGVVKVATKRVADRRKQADSLRSVLEGTEV